MLILLTAAVAPPARAADASPPEAPVPPEALAPQELFQRAGEAFQGQNFKRALGLLQQACQHSDFEGCEFNLGAVHHALRHCAEAREHYAAYLAAHPQGTRRAEARAALAALAPHCGPENPASSESPVAEVPARGVSSAQSPAALPPAPLPPRAVPPGAVPPGVLPLAALPPPPALPAQVEAPPQAPARAGGTGRMVALSLLGIGGAAGVATLVLALELRGANADVEAHRSQAFGAEQRGRLDRARQLQSLTLGAGVATALLLGSSAAVWWLSPADSPQIGIAFGPDLELHVLGRL